MSMNKLFTSYGFYCQEISVQTFQQESYVKEELIISETDFSGLYCIFIHNSILQLLNKLSISDKSNNI